MSIIIPTYYRNNLLTKALDSVRATEYESVEVIIVDDSGEGHARPVINEYDVVYVPLKENRGQNAALNRGLEEISGEYVQFLDDDDMVLPGKLTKQVDLLESAEDVGVVYCGVEMDSGEVMLPKPDKRGEVLEDALTFSLSPCLTSGMLFDANILDRVAPLPTVPGSTDIYMMIECALRTKFDFVNEALIRKRDSEDSVGSSAAAIEGNRQVFNAYDDVYERVGKSVRRRAMGSFYNRAGRFHVSEQFWSVYAISAFGKAVYYTPGLSIPFVGRLLGSMFGRPGVRTVERAMSAVSGMKNDLRQ